MWSSRKRQRTRRPDEHGFGRHLREQNELQCTKNQPVQHDQTGQYPIVPAFLAIP